MSDFPKGLRKRIIETVQKKADTPKQKIDASIVSRVASLTIDEVLNVIEKGLQRGGWK